jgi:hypothetical protein
MGEGYTGCVKSQTQRLRPAARGVVAEPNTPGRDK